MRYTNGFQTAVILTIGLCLFAIREALAQPRIDVKVVGITDGDTITVIDSEKRQFKIRLPGIDAPEKKAVIDQRLVLRSKHRRNIRLLVVRTVEFK